MNSKKLLFIISSVALAISLFFAFQKGLEERKNPNYLYLDTLLLANGFKEESKIDTTVLKKYRLVPLKEKLDDFKEFYLSFHKKTRVDSFENMIEKPFLPSWEYEKFFYYFKPLIKNKRIVISGVTGSGKTTIIDKLSRFITGSEERVLHLQCVEEMAVEYHKEWVGMSTPNGFMPGKLLKFFELCRADTNHNYIFILDDIDKIYPSTFFGSELWSEMDNPESKNLIQGYGEIRFPDNFYLISITHIGVSNLIELNNEHYRRLGERLPINPDANEFLLGIKERIQEKDLKIPFKHIKNLVFFFIEANKYIEKNYGMSYTLGQWATIRKKIEPDEWGNFVQEFITHVSAFKPNKPLQLEDFDNIFYSMENNGLVKNSYFFYRLYESMLETGLFSELSVALAFASCSAIFGWIFIMKKRKFLNYFQSEILRIVDDFRIQKINHEKAMLEIYENKNTLEKLILKRKIKYEESSFLILFVNDQIKQIENINQERVVSSDFQKLLEEFMIDGILDEEEYRILNRFLDNIRSALQPDIYYSLKKKIDNLKNNS